MDTSTHTYIHNNTSTFAHVHQFTTGWWPQYMSECAEFRDCWWGALAALAALAVVSSQVKKSSCTTLQCTWGHLYSLAVYLALVRMYVEGTHLTSYIVIVPTRAVLLNTVNAIDVHAVSSTHKFGTMQFSANLSRNTRMAARCGMGLNSWKTLSCHSCHSCYSCHRCTCCNCLLPWAILPTCCSPQLLYIALPFEVPFTINSMSKGPVKVRARRSLVVISF